MCCKMVSSEHDMTIKLINSQKPWLPAQGLHKTEHQYFSVDEKGLMRPHPFLRNYWQVMAAGRGQSVFFSGITIGKLPVNITIGKLFQ